MDATRFDRLARALAAPGARRALLRAALGAGLAAFAIAKGEKGAARNDRTRSDRRARNRDRGGLAAEKKRKKKKKTCKPKCAGKSCGPNGCPGGTCGTCSLATRCNAAGQCVGCLSGGDCALRACNTVACASDTCVYTPVGSDPACAAPNRCFLGQCIECRVAADCPPQTCRDVTCSFLGDCDYAVSANGAGCGGADDICCGGTCVNTANDEANCGACGVTCPSQTVCSNGVCCNVCASGCPFSTMQAAQNAASSGATIRVCPGTYTGQTFFGKNLTVIGMGDEPGDTVLSNIFAPMVSTQIGVAVTLRNLKITGVTSGSLGAIGNQGTLTLDRVEVSGNTTSFLANSPGGGATNSGTLNLIDSVFSANIAGRGGGILSTGNVTLTRSLIDGNQANTEGGGVFTTGSLILNDNSRIRNNQATTGGGVLNAGGTVVIDGTSSIAGNPTGGQCVNTNGGTGCPA